MTDGCATEPARFCPYETVARVRMASFLVRAFGLPQSPPAGFVDVGGGPHAANIDALAASGVTSGCRTEPLRYSPGRDTQLDISDQVDVASGREFSVTVWARNKAGKDWVDIRVNPAPTTTTTAALAVPGCAHQRGHLWVGELLGGSNVGRNSRYLRCQSRVHL